MEDKKQEDKVVIPTRNFKEAYGDFDCPGCGRSTRNGDDIYDAGNGFCQDCEPEH